MVNIRINDLPEDDTPQASDFVAIDALSTRKTSIADLVEIGRPLASQSEAEAGTDPSKAMTPLTTAQAIDAQRPAGSTGLDLLLSGTAADARGVLGVGVTGEDVFLANTAADIRALLDLEPGTDVQAQSAILQSLADETLTAGDLLYAADATTIANLPIGTDGQVLGVNAGVLAWQTAGIGDLVAANNLSDLASASTARTNLELGTAAVEDAADLLARANHTGTQAGTTVLLSDPAGDGNTQSVQERTEKFPSITDWNLVEGDDPANSAANTIKLQAAIDYIASLGNPAEKGLEIPNGIWLYDEVVVPPAARAMCFNGRGASSELRSTKTTAGAAILLDTIGVKFNDLKLSMPPTDNTTINIIVQGKRQTNTVADIDAVFNNCVFQGGYYHVEVVGRGLTVRGGFGSLARYCFNIDWPADGTYVEGDETHQKKATGMRRFEFSDFEGHALSVGIVRNLGANAGNIKGLILNNLRSNIGDTIFSGHLGEGALVIGCNATQMTGPALQVTGGRDYMVADLVAMGTLDADPDQEATNFITLTGTQTDGVFRGFNFAYCTNHGIDARSGTFTDILFETGKVKEYGPSSFAAIAVIGSGHRIHVHGLTTKMGTAGISQLVAQSGSTIFYRDVRAIGSAETLSSGGGTFTAV